MRSNLRDSTSFPSGYKALCRCCEVALVRSESEPEYATCPTPCGIRLEYRVVVEHIRRFIRYEAEKIGEKIALDAVRKIPGAYRIPKTIQEPIHDLIRVVRDP